MTKVLTATSADGTDISGVDQGQGRVILILHPGLDDGASWHRVATRLATRFRVVRPHRRQYRFDLTAGQPFSIGQEVADVMAITKQLDGPILLVGHSSGGVVALEALATSPAMFAGAVLYEPPIHLRPAEWETELEQAKAAIAARRPGKAMTIFVRDIVRLPSWTARLVGLFVAVSPRMRALAPHHIDDADAIQQLGVRLDVYARIQVPTVLLGGSRTPAHVGQRLDPLARTLPHAEKVVLSGQGHNAQQRAPDDVARIIETLADKVLR